MTAGGTTPSSTRDTSTTTDVLIGTIILISAQICCASTATCVHSLPAETPSVLRGLWRQTLTSIIFSFIYGIRRLLLTSRKKKEKDPNKEGTSPCEDGAHLKSFSGVELTIIALAIIGTTLQNDTIVIALEYASSAAVMCLCNTTPLWLILYAIVHCGLPTPGCITILGAGLSLLGAIICSTSEGDDSSSDESSPQNESLGAIIATIGGIGGAIYMTACRKLGPIGICPITLSLINNIGMMIVSGFLCIATLPNGVDFASKNITNGFWGFVNHDANPAALLHSVFPDLGGNFGIMLSLTYFEPLIVSMVMLTEPLNASLIAMNVVGEAPPTRRTIFGVCVVLFGCGIVLWESSKENKALEELEDEELPLLEEKDRKDIQRRRESTEFVLMSRLSVAPNATASVFLDEGQLSRIKKNRRVTLPSNLERVLSLGHDFRSSEKSLIDLDDQVGSSRRITLQPSILRRIGEPLRMARESLFARTSGYGSIPETKDEEIILLE